MGGSGVTWACARGRSRLVMVPGDVDFQRPWVLRPAQAAGRSLRISLPYLTLVSVSSATSCETQPSNFLVCLL